MKRKLSIFILLALLMTLFVLPAQASELGYVTDAAELLNNEDWQYLETLCGNISEQYDCGVYVITVDDYQEYGDGDVYEVTYGIYHEYALGMGAERNGIVLLLSMADRDFATFVYGDDAEYAFDDYGLLCLEDYFLPPFGENDWFGGFDAYVKACADYLALAAAGEPVRGDSTMLIVLCVLASFFVALVVVNIMKLGMKNVQKADEAAAYLSAELTLTNKRDQYIKTTETRRKIEKDDDKSESRSGGGGSGRTGKF